MLKINFNKKKIHLIGIGGVCINSIAKFLLNEHCHLTGSDIRENDNIINLRKLGIKIFIGHNSKNINNKINYIIKSSAIDNNNVEIIKSKKLNIKILERGYILQYFLNKSKFSISISGSHGKTTTTSLLINCLIEEKINPTFINGGILKNLNSYSKIGNNKYFIIESDESDKSFLYLKPNIIVINNISNDHVRTYNNNFNELKKSFVKYTENLKKNGSIVICNDNVNNKYIIKNINKKYKIYTYGFSKNSDFVIYNYIQKINYIIFTIYNKINKNNIKIKLKNLIGKHNALNSTAAFIVSFLIKISMKSIKNSMNKFLGVKNRIEITNKDYLFKNDKSAKKNIIIINDYGHHPYEIKNVLNTIKLIKFNNLIMIFQPHRFTRTYDLKLEFSKILKNVDFLILLKIYSAEEKVNLISSLNFFNFIKKYKKKNVFFSKEYSYTIKIIKKIINNNDLLLFQGAGDIHSVYKDINNFKNN